MTKEFRFEADYLKIQDVQQSLISVVCEVTHIACIRSYEVRIMIAALRHIVMVYKSMTWILLRFCRMYNGVFMAMHERTGNLQR